MTDAKLGRLSVEFRELTVDTTLDRVPAPSPVEFYREYVAASKPVIFTGAIDHWPAMKKWSNSYLEATVGGKKVTVDITPDGRGDSICETVKGDPSSAKFVTPLCEPMTMGEFFSLLASSKEDESKGVPYVQHQNSNFREEYHELWGDVDEEIGFATEAFGCQPDAVNIWIGDERSVTSFHKDHYENLYAVVSGRKIFTIMPPVDSWRLYTKSFPAAEWRRGEGGQGFVTHDLEPATEVPWIQVNPYPHPDDEWEACKKFKRFWSPNLPKPLQVVVNAGEVLYLPSLWFHHVGQVPDDEGRCIAVNYWYDMKFDIRYAYYNAVEELGKEEEGEVGKGMEEVDRVTNLLGGTLQTHSVDIMNFPGANDVD